MDLLSDIDGFVWKVDVFLNVRIKSNQLFEVYRYIFV